MQEFLERNQWTKTTLNPNEFDKLQRQIISNLIYYQSNYGAILLPFFVLIM